MSKVWAYANMKPDYGPHEYRCELAAADPIVRAVGVSRLCRSMQSMCASILKEGSELKLILKEDVYEKARAEATAMKDHFTLLNGYGIPMKAGGSMRKSKVNYRAENDVRVSVAKLLDWSKQPSAI